MSINIVPFSREIRKEPNIKASSWTRLIFYLVYYAHRYQGVPTNYDRVVVSGLFFGPAGNGPIDSLVICVVLNFSLDHNRTHGFLIVRFLASFQFSGIAYDLLVRGNRKVYLKEHYEIVNKSGFSPQMLTFCYRNPFLIKN